MALYNLTEAEKTIQIDETVTDLKHSSEIVIKDLLTEYETELESNLNLMDETVTDLKHSIKVVLKNLLAEYETDLESNLNISKVEVNFIVKMDGIEV
ncbi:hypothetical protein EO98_11525 [Methanosarcina sp. 2.H.T.1A.6]|uniref:hypothetical protein n=1 Tax=unclassified Methanosarcina TaxID=2644672 RepID=UPI0006228CE4|nr:MULTISPECIES: hypothetical protein [unclassified Methanosarcina]KKG17159.1 hypothetical protein EO94_12935 [Methanosarcina sp. 2.H.T.1A.3]KKG19248.1 hypothetical protein EO98_11525 [Methanosarcina sp. 2.H.T.1A.6]KKG23989.1 hypothetical protein EO96_13505 [Methanosarcina sp. 2.H.T.1A.8]KKG24346.1 hypothetical protein EO97_16790 [Methanosarcina sp. 2.H.T.1A.15]